MGHSASQILSHLFFFLRGRETLKKKAVHLYNIFLKKQNTKPYFQGENEPIGTLLLFFLSLILL